MIKKYDHILIDVYNIYFRASWVEEDRYVFYNKEKIETGGIYGSLKMIQRIIALYLNQGGQVYFLFDNAKSKVTRRKTLDSGYKVNRSQLNPSFYAGINFLEIILKSYIDNAKIIRIPSYEADDHVEPILNSLPKDSYKLLVSNDMDWARTIDATTHWLRKKDNKDSIIDIESFCIEYKFMPSVKNIEFYKVFYGDDSDDIKPLMSQLSHDRFLKVIEDCRDMDDFIDKAITHKLEYLDEGWCNRISKDKDALNLNWVLVSFADIPESELRNNTMQCKYNDKMLKMYYNLFGFSQDVDSRISYEANLDSIMGL